jgi:hypothetical protein
MRREIVVRQGFISDAPDEVDIVRDLVDGGVSSYEIPSQFDSRPGRTDQDDRLVRLTHSFPPST